ncbi:MAG: hypothetical protein ABR611_15450, partial [Chthoniobacterales bacterium]
MLLQAFDDFLVERGQLADIRPMFWQTDTAIFTIVNATLIERLPYADPQRLVAVWEENARRPGRANVVGPSNYLRWRERATVFEAISAFADTRRVITGSGDPEEVTTQLS